ncbi:deleted in malignant brain tumors 1 protein-like isoform X2 [Ruditapes philippinarum]|uniref:deleted in malignant brain tumors 1 protein-like isoform X2 n=1 Tax=Ruditapes philippinarum TaxID=129788 RepID=UPI00295AD7DA|nr:deleted in malignant brain tumors 1 protein-like isoform X2 [Ruditapes philippinarum]
MGHENIKMKKANFSTIKLQFWVILLHALTRSIAGGEKLNVNGIRLVNGTQPYSGRVEISINGVWGTVCDDSFDIYDAQVMCKMMNLTATAFKSGAFYGPGIGPIFAQRFVCYSFLSHLKDCEFVPNAGCTHDRDISIFCSECGKLEIRNGEIQSISADGRNIVIACIDGYSSNITISTCENGSWSVPTINCTSESPNIRLVNGIGLYDGRVEIFKSGTWGTICSTSFIFYEAKAICNILFGQSSYRDYYRNSITYGSGTGSIHIDNLDCDGYETNIDECKYSREVSCTDHDRDVAVACNKWPMNLVTNTRLVNGTGPYDGRIELFVNGQWGTIDARFVDMYDARTLCKTHNASLAIYFESAIYGQGTGPILSRELNCDGEQSHIRKCSGKSPYGSSSHTYDLSIACTSCGVPTIYNGEPISFNGNELTIACHIGSLPKQVTMTCQQDKSWFQKQRCTPYLEYPLTIEEVLLQDGYIPTEGRVELKVNGTWGTICGTGFDSADAQVVCYMFGLQYKKFSVKAKHSSKFGSGPIYISNMTCNGTESHINECRYEISNNCTHYDDVAVECTGYHLNITDVRLAGTNGPYHGRVEVKVNKTWGTVCHNSFTSTEALLICRMLGLPTYENYHYHPLYGHGSGPIYLDKLDCGYYATHFNQCRYSINNYYNCDHSDDVSVVCYGPTLNITDARLVNGTSIHDGRAEIKVNDTWGTICDNNFDIQAADLFCRILGLRAAQYFTGAIYGEGSGPVFIDQLFCNSYDYTLSDCNYLFLNECSHARDISVVCNECGQPDIFFWGVDFFTYNGTTLFADCSYYKTYVGKLELTCNNKTQEWVTEGECQEYNFPLDLTDIRLVNGPNSTAGRVEIKSLDTWGTVCGNAFGIQEANVICRMLGYPPAMGFYGKSHFGAGKGPIFIDDLICHEDAVHLNNCTYETYDNCNHDDDIAVVCTDCGNPTPNNGFTNSTKTNYGAAVHVSCDKDHILDGKSDIICQINGEWTNKPRCKLIDCGDPNTCQWES